MNNKILKAILGEELPKPNAHPLYGCIDSNVTIQEYGVAADVFFYHAGINLVYLDGSGHVALAITATATLLGWAIVPKGMGAGSDATYWKAAAVAGADKIQVVTSLDARFLLPADEAVTESMKGNACDIIAVDDGTATTINVGTSSTDVMLIVDEGVNHGGVAASVVVKLNPAKIQADT